MIVELSGGGLSATANIWKQDRFVIKFTANSAGMTVLLWTNLHGSANSPLATYTADANSIVYIDMSDYIRTYVDSIGSTLTISVYDVSSTVSTIVGTCKGLINPEDVLIPYHSLLANDALIMPPSMMICDLDQSSNETAEFYATSGTWSVSGSASIASNKRFIGQIEGQFTVTDGTHSKTIIPRGKICGREYVYVQWVSFTGVTRTHTFEVVKGTIEGDGEYDLLEIDNSYHEIKGRKDGFSIKLDGLCPYDYWYYSDVLHSSDVQVSFDGSNYTRVKVESKKVTIPDGANFDGKIKIALNWKRYDAVAM